MKNLVSILAIALSLIPRYHAYGQENPYLSLSFDSVVIYDFDWRDPATKKIISIIDTLSGDLASTVKKSAKLDKKTTLQLARLLGSESSYGQGVAACFEPHLGIVFYRSGKYVAHVNVCIGCNRLESSLRIPAQNQGKQQVDDDVYYTLYGLSKSFRSYLNKLITRNNFSHGITPGSMFD